jgi:hypothetical protein
VYADVRRLVAMDLKKSVEGLPGVQPLMPLGAGIMMRCVDYVVILFFVLFEIVMTLFSTIHFHMILVYIHCCRFYI